VHPPAVTEPAPAVEARGIRKSFDGVEVLHGVDFALRAGEIHGIVGQNGAGKSTLVKILNGVYERDAGETHVRGQLVDYADPLAARRLGIAMVFQEFSLIPTLTVTQNVLLTREPHLPGGLIDDRAARRRTSEVLEQLGSRIDPDAPVERLPVGTRQLVEIGKAISQDARVLILDEPTASLTAAEITTLFTAIRRLASRGIGVVYISHHLNEVLEICDRVTVLRDGEVKLSAPASELSLGAVIRAMLGQSLERELAWQPHLDRKGDEPVLNVRGLSSGKVRDVSFDLFPGEIVGIAGLLGSGRTELLRALFGLDRAEGSIVLRGERRAFGSPRAALQAGLALVPEDRRQAGLVPEHDVKSNVLMAAWGRVSRLGFVRDRLGDQLVSGFVERLKIRTPSLRQEVRRLSGGNQQKVVVAKNLAIRPRVMLLDDPTVGIDVKSKADILDEVRALAADGNGILLVSSELEELAALCDRVMVVDDGTIVRWLDRSKGDDLTEEALTHAIQGVES
jgi:ribose transport system ATP-binding protein